MLAGATATLLAGAAVAGTSATAQASPTPRTSTASAQPFTGHGQGNYGIWATNVNVRTQVGTIPLNCIVFPSVAECPDVVDTVSAPETVFVNCQSKGQTVGGNPYWLNVQTARGRWGWMASYYTNNSSNFIDGLPICGDVDVHF